MLSPGAKGWISKYFDMIEKGDLWVSIRNYEDLSLHKHIHLTCSRSGIIFGLPTRAIFGHKLKTEKWTRHEKLKVLLFEALLFVHLKNGGKLDKEAFFTELLNFYRDHKATGISKVFSFFRKESPEERLEKVLSKRADIKLNIFENKWWVNSLNNAFVYLDVILFNDFLSRGPENPLEDYIHFAQNALIAVTLSSHADGIIDDLEVDLFNVFLASANLPEDQRAVAIERFNEGAGMDDFQPFVHSNWLFKRFLLDISILTVFSKLEANEEERKLIFDLRQFLNIPEEELEQTMMFVENFIIENREQSEFLKDAPSYEKVYGSFYERWKKILLRNKDKLAVEVRESKELVQLIKKSRSEELTPEEKEKVKQQLKDILKAMPAFAVFMIPGGSVLLPMMLKLIPDLLPSAFKENEIEE